MSKTKHPQKTAAIFSAMRAATEIQGELARGDSSLSAEQLHQLAEVLGWLAYDVKLGSMSHADYINATHKSCKDEEARR